MFKKCAGISILDFELFRGKTEFYSCEQCTQRVVDWQTRDKKILKRIDRFARDIFDIQSANTPAAIRR